MIIIFHGAVACCCSRKLSTEFGGSEQDSECV
jgi:hypothetical protein